MNTSLLSIIAAGLEIALNQRLYRDNGLKPLRKNLIGKVIVIHLRELSQPLALIFAEQQLNVITAWRNQADCTITTHLRALMRLSKKLRVAEMIRERELDVTGDLQLLNHFAALMIATEQDLVEIFTPYTGDIIAQGVNQLIKQMTNFATKKIVRNQRYISEVLTEEWCVVPGKLQSAWFCAEVDKVEEDAALLLSRIIALEKKCYLAR